MNMVEKIARVICSTDNKANFSLTQAQYDRIQDRYIMQARAVLAALLEPTEVMIEEGGEYLNTAYNNWQSDCQRAVIVLQKMIQAALDEK